MRRRMLAAAILAVCALHVPGLAATAGGDKATGATAPAVLTAPGAAPGTSAAINAMHPAFSVVDEAGVPVLESSKPASAERTCGACHDAEYINAHNGHWNARVKATCVECHFEGGRFPADPSATGADGRLRREAIRISSPPDANCAACHGVIHLAAAPLSIPEGFGESAGGDRDDGFTLFTGAVFSPQNLSDSYLNLEGKAGRTYPWDAHARRLVRCVDCHFSSNNPMRRDVKQASLDFLANDPRRIPLSEFLRRPDHRLAAATCRSCHDPMTVHDFLPYKRRHLEALECASCHIPHPMGPAAQMIDATVVREDGAPAIVFRGMDRGDAASLNTAYAAGYTPLLLRRRDPPDGRKLGPFNAVDTWFWASGTGHRTVSPDTVRRAYLEQGRYAAPILALFDADHDGTIQSRELRLDSAAKMELIRSRLRALGVADPVIRHTVSLHALEHGVLSGEQVQRDCSRCHARASRVNGSLALAVYTPSGAAPAGPDDMEENAPADGFRLRSFAGGSLIEAGGPGSAGRYVFGNSRRAWTNPLGFGIFLAVLAGVLLHGTFRVVTRRPRAAGAAPGERVYLYPVYERVWHWLMAMSILALMLTGLQVEFAGVRALLPLPTAVAVHNFFAVVLIANAFLSLFYHVATSAIRQFIPPRDGLARKVAEHARYYARGIFLGQPNPTPRSQDRKLNPLQQLTYLALLNILFPLQVVTGALIWGASRWPHLADAVGGLSVVAPLHDLGSWLFIAFFVLHLYLTTTGHTVFSHINAMIDGYGEAETGTRMEMGGSHA